MKKFIVVSCMAFTAVLLSTGAVAHDPKEHMGKSEKPKCSEMKKMDHKNMDMNDPVMQAMMKKCMSQMNHDMPEGNHEAHGEETTSEKSENSDAHDGEDH